MAATFPNELRFNITPADIEKIVEDVIAKSKTAHDAVAAVPAGQHTFENTIKALANCEGAASSSVSVVYFMKHVSTDPDVRKASTEASKKLDEFEVELSTREDVYNSVMAFNEAHGASVQDPIEKRLMEKIIKDYQRDGLGLPLEKRERVKEIMKRLSVLSIDFAKNIADDNTTLEFTREELNGCPERMLGSLKKTDDGQRLVVTLKYPDYFPVMKNCSVESTRKTMERAYNMRCMTNNTVLLEEALKLKMEKAQLLGFDSHAHYVLDDRMAKTPVTLVPFLTDLKANLAPAAHRELSVVLDIKRHDCKERGLHFDGKINGWDLNYYARILQERDFKFEEEVVRKYFPLEYVTQQMLALYQELLGLTFEELTDTKHVWHEDVRMFEVKDAADRRLIGHFYLDLFPRDNKFSHAAAFGFKKGFFKPDGEWQYPASAMVANFTKPTATAPSLLNHGEVVTYFHELGHVFHGLCTTAKYSRFSGTSVERDFVEAPSQMLENWCWQKDVLRRLSRHVDDGTPLPDATIDQMVAAKNLNIALMTRRQLLYGIFDMTIHLHGCDNTEALWAKLRPEITLIEHTEGTNPAAAFGHIMGGYDAGYYGYLYSEVFSADMFETFKKEGVFNPAVGMRYRTEILAPGGGRDSMESLMRFLGRAPEQEAFLKHLGLA